MFKNQQLAHNFRHKQTRPSASIYRSSMICAILLSLTLSAVFLCGQVCASETPQQKQLEPAQPEQQNQAKESLPANHKMAEPEDSWSPGAPTKQSRRQSRQYDGTMSSSSVSNNYAAMANDAGAYVGQLPSSSNYAGSQFNLPTSNYVNEPSSAYHSSYHDLLAMARGYAPTSPVSGYPSMGHHPAAGAPPTAGLLPHPSMFPSTASQLASFSSSMFPLMSKGFDVSEIVCTAIAVAIGAVIVGAPFILIYLFIMNQMNGGGGAVGPNGGSISLTGPTSSTTVSGRKKRHTSLPEALFKQLSPLVNNEQVAQTFKILMNSLAKYQ